MNAPAYDEMEAMNAQVKDVWLKVDEWLQKEGRSARFLGLKDRQKLTILRTWAIRHRVPLGWVIHTLLNALRKSPRQKRGAKWGHKGLPVTVKGLVSKGTEELLQEEIRKAFPNGEHLEIWRQHQQESILEARLRERYITDEPVIGLLWVPVLSYRSLEQYHRAYAQKMKTLRQYTTAIRREAREYGRPYRNSPWS